MKLKIKPELKYVDLTNGQNHMKQIKLILKRHPELCLRTYFFANHSFNTETVSMARSNNHIVAVFAKVEDCVLLDRGDGIRWGTFAD